MRYLPMVLACSLAAPAAMAQTPPAITPTRDVAVTYRVTGQGPGNGTEMQMSWQASTGLMRVDLPGGQGFMVINQRDGMTGFVVMEAQRMIMDIPAGQLPPAANMQPSANARFTREGTARVANTDCTVWRMEDRGQAGRTCLTADGVMLRAQADGNQQAQVEATAVNYGAQNAARFQRPAGYQALQMPTGVPGAPGGLPRGTAMPPPGMTPPAR
nr:hypothetical protein [uncultured Roseococcus sp.]